MSRSLLLMSEDFQHERTYGSVRAVDPFQPAGT
jgi:predicted nucleic acid-binding protein